MAVHLASHRIRLTSGSSSQDDEELFEAIKQKDASQIKSLLGKEIRLDWINDSGYTVLGVAAQTGFTKSVALLLESGCAVNKPDFYGQIPIQYAAEFGHLEALLLLIEHESDVNWMDTNKDGLSALHLATLGGHADIVKALIKGKCDVNVKDINSITALHCAVGNEQVDLVRLLLETRARVNVRVNKTRRTPLLMAAEVGNMEILNMLLNRRAAINIPDHYGMTALCLVCLQNNTDIALRLVEVGAKVGNADNTGSLPLHYAARYGNTKIMSAVINKGTELNKLNKNIETPLYLAVKYCHLSAVQLLMKYGSGVLFDGLVNVIDTAVHSSITSEDFLCLLEMLIEGGCIMDSSVCHTNSETPLYCATSMGKVDFAIMLLQHGADPNACCPFDVTILQKACEKKCDDLVHTLLHCNLDWRRELWLDTDIHMSGINPKLLTGYAENIPRVLLDNIDLYFTVQTVRCNPATLMDFCRWCIRSSLADKLHMKVSRLHLPLKLQEYVMLKIL